MEILHGFSRELDGVTSLEWQWCKSTGEAYFTARFQRNGRAAGVRMSSFIASEPTRFIASVFGELMLEDSPLVHSDYLDDVIDFFKELHRAAK